MSKTVTECAPVLSLVLKDCTKKNKKGTLSPRMLLNTLKKYFPDIDVCIQELDEISSEENVASMTTQVQDFLTKVSDWIHDNTDAQNHASHDGLMALATLVMALNTKNEMADQVIAQLQAHVLLLTTENTHLKAENVKLRETLLEHHIECLPVKPIELTVTYAQKKPGRKTMKQLAEMLAHPPTNVPGPKERKKPIKTPEPDLNVYIRETGTGVSTINVKPKRQAS